MKLFTVLSIALSCINTAAAWSSTNHWQTSVILDTITTSQTVHPTGAASATSTNTSTTTVYGGDPLDYYTFEITVTDLFYPSAADICTFKCPTTTPSTSDGITTAYWVPVLIANPTTCTKTSFEYTTASRVYLPSDRVPDIAQQATQSVEALFVTTYVSTLSTNMGGQAVTTTVCDVYLRSDAVSDVGVAEEFLLTECVDPRSYYCLEYSTAISRGVTTVDTKTICELTGQTYPPTAIASAATTGAATTGTANPTKSSGAGSLGISSMEFRVSLAVSGFAALLVSFY